MVVNNSKFKILIDDYEVQRHEFKQLYIINEVEKIPIVQIIYTSKTLNNISFTNFYSNIKIIFGSENNQEVSKFRVFNYSIDHSNDGWQITITGILDCLDFIYKGIQKVYTKDISIDNHIKTLYNIKTKENIPNFMDWLQFNIPNKKMLDIFLSHTMKTDNSFYTYGFYSNKFDKIKLIDVKTKLNEIDYIIKDTQGGDYIYDLLNIESSNYFINSYYNVSNMFPITDREKPELSPQNSFNYIDYKSSYLNNSFIYNTDLPNSYYENIYKIYQNKSSFYRVNVTISFTKDYIKDVKVTDTIKLFTSMHDKYFNGNYIVTKKEMIITPNSTITKFRLNRNFIKV